MGWSGVGFWLVQPRLWLYTSLCFFSSILVGSFGKICPLVNLFNHVIKKNCFQCSWSISSRQHKALQGPKIWEYSEWRSVNNTLRKQKLQLWTCRNLICSWNNIDGDLIEHYCPNFTIVWHSLKRRFHNANPAYIQILNTETREFKHQLTYFSYAYHVHSSTSKL